MRKPSVPSLRQLCVAIFLPLGLGFTVPGMCFDRSGVVSFAQLPEGSTTPEGLTLDEAGNVYTSTFDMTRAGKAGQIVVFDKTGQLLRVLEIPGASNLLLDLAFHPGTGALLVVDFGGKKVLKVDPSTGASTVFMSIPGKTPASNPGPNAPAFDRHGNVYVSDSFQGIIWRTGPDGGEPVEWLNDELLRTNGVPRFGANGLAFNKAGNSLFIANTGNRQIVKVPVENGIPGTPSVFVNSVGGPDGFLIDDDEFRFVEVEDFAEFLGDL